MSAEVARVLREAADLIEPPGRWTQGAFARTAEGERTQSKDESAVCWCAGGAVSRVAEPPGLWHHAMKALYRLIPETVPGGVGLWNDQQPSVKPVVAALRAAADAVEAEEARDG